MVGPADPHWLDDDRDKALWWLVHDRERCASCGHRPAEFDPREGGDPHAYEWGRLHCRGCELLAQGNDWLEKNRKDGTVRRGTSIYLRPPRPAE